jgi:hypothetical protein
MANIIRSIKEKMDSVPNKNNTVQMKLNIVKEMYSILLSQEGRDYLTQVDNFRTILERKVIEFMDDDVAENDLQFMSQSRLLLTVVANINLGKIL